MLERIRSDRNIIARVLRGNPESFRILVDRYSGLVYGMAYARVGNAADAEDIAQDTFVKLYQWLDRVAWTSSIGPWLVEVARNAATDVLRKRQRETALSDVPSNALGAVIPRPDRDELRRLVWEHLAVLDADEREVLVLYYFRGHRAKDIAAYLGVSPDAAAKRLQRARDALGRQLVQTLGSEMVSSTDDKHRTERIMAAVAAVPVTWDTATAAAGVLAAVAVKIAVGLVAVAMAGGGAYYGWRYLHRPFNTQDITARSHFAQQRIAAPPPSATPKPQPAVPGTAAANPVADPAENAAEKPKPWKPDPLPPFEVVVSGAVYDAQGQPVPNATVVIDNDEAVDQDKRARRLADKNSEFEDRPVVVPARYVQSTDEAGRFQFAPITLADEFSWQQNYRISAEADTRYAEERFFDIRERRERYVELALTPTEALSGYVFDPDGKPLDCAFVGMRGCNAQKAVHDMTSAFSEPDGRFEFPHLPVGSYWFMVHKPGFRPVNSHWIKTGKDDVVFSLDRGLQIKGRLTDADTGQALSGVYLMAFESRENNAQGTTDSTGRFTLSGLLANTYEVTLSSYPADAPPYVLTAPARVTLSQTTPSPELDLKAIRGATVSGHVLDSLSGKPVAGVQICLTQGDTDSWAHMASSDIAGKYTIRGVPAGEWTADLLGRSQEYGESKQSVKVPGLEDVKGVDFRMPPVVRMTGNVVDANGKPATNAMVCVASAKGNEWPRSFQADPTGHFAAKSSYLPSSVYIQASAGGALSRRIGPVKSIGEGHVLKLEPAGRIEGTVIDQDGKPFPGAVIAAIPTEEDTFNIAYKAVGWCRSKDIGGMKTTASHAGFLFTPVLPGEYRLEVYPASAPTSVPIASAKVHVATGQTLQTELVIDATVLAMIEGQVTINGQPAQGIPMATHTEDWLGDMETSTDAEGRYTFLHVAPGNVTVTAEVLTSPYDRDATRREQSAEVAPGTTVVMDFDVTIEDTVVEGYITINGESQDGALITIAPIGATEGESQITTTADSHGLYRVTGLPEGRYALLASKMLSCKGPRLEPPKPTQIQVTPGKTVRADIDLKGGSIQGRLCGLRPGERAAIAVFPASAASLSLELANLASLEKMIIASQEAAQDGPFEFKALAEGEYLLAAVGIPADEAIDAASIVKCVTSGRYATVRASIITGETAAIDVTLP